MKERKFIKLPPEKAPQMFDLVLERMKWMDEKGIEQWNVMGYDEVYPLSYYEQKCREGRAFALENKDGAILCAAVLLENDSRWSDDVPALYVHNLVSKVGAGDAGAEFLRRRFLGTKAKINGKRGLNAAFASSKFKNDA